MSEKVPTRAPRKRPTTRDAIATASRLHERALRSHAERRLEEARVLCARSLRILERESGPWDPDVANALNTYGFIQQDLGFYAETEATFRRSVEIVLHLSSDPDLDRLRVRSFAHLADILRVEGRYREAEPLFQRALSVAEVAFGPDDLHVSSVLNGWAVLCRYSGRFDEAGRLYRRALAIMEKALGPEHVELATIDHHL